MSKTEDTDFIPTEDESENKENICNEYDDSSMIDGDEDTMTDDQQVFYNPYAYTHNLKTIFGQAFIDTRDGIALTMTRNVIDRFQRNNEKFSIVDILNDGVAIVGEWLKGTDTYIAMYNDKKEEDKKIRRFSNITPRAITLLIMATGDFRTRLDVRNKKNGILMRQRFGDDIGTWKLQDGRDFLDILISSLNSSANQSYRKEVRYNLETELETVAETRDNKIAMLQDGIYDFTTQEFMSYEHSDYDKKYGHVISQSKLYGINWTDETSDDLEKKCTICNPNDGTVWSPLQGLKDLVGDGVALQAIREIMHFAIRRTRGNFAWFFVNTTGNAAGGGGKSTVIQIIKNMCGGENNCITLSYDRLGENFALNGIENKYAILSDETAGTNKRPENTEVYKTIATNGSVLINVKFKDMYFTKFDGCMIQACNGYPMFSDQTDSMFRRFLALPFEKQMTKNGRKKDYIRDDYINRPEVIQCYVKWAMELGCLDTYSEDVIDYCLPYVEEIKNNTKTVFEFMPEMMRLQKAEGYFDGMNEIGRSFLYALYCKWDEAENSTRIHLSRKKFWISVCEWVQSNPSCGWIDTDKVTHIYPNTPFQKELVDYDLGKEWCQYILSANNIRRQTGYFSFSQKSIRCGLIRVNKLPKNTVQGAVTQDTTD